MNNFSTQSPFATTPTWQLVVDFNQTQGRGVIGGMAYSFRRQEIERRANNQDEAAVRYMAMRPEKFTEPTSHLSPIEELELNLQAAKHNVATLERQPASAKELADIF